MVCWYAMHANKLSHILPVHKPHKRFAMCLQIQKAKEKAENFHGR